MIDPQKLMMLRQASAALSGAMDRVDDLLTEAEESLKDVDVEAWLPDAAQPVGFSLGWANLFVVRINGQVEPLLESPQWMRIEALGHLDALMDAIAVRATELLKKATAHITMANVYDKGGTEK